MPLDPQAKIVIDMIEALGVAELDRRHRPERSCGR